MSDISITRIDRNLVNSWTSEFPGGSWQRVSGRDIHAPTSSRLNGRNWQAVEKVRKVGGNYVFLFPERFFSDEREIHLDGPSKRKIPFRFCVKTHSAQNGHVAVYVGKASNLSQRFQWHFSLSERNTGAQVQSGLVKCGICKDRPEAVDFMLQHAVIFYREVPGDGHAANRDLLELSLCARFAPPFNIKSER